MSNILSATLYWLYLLFIFVFLTLFLIYSVYSLLADFMGAPFVPTSAKMINSILEKAKLKKGQVFIELGSGDGRVVRQAVQKYGVKGIGVELQPILVWYSRLRVKLQGLEGIKFIQGNLFKVNLSRVYPEQSRRIDVIFLFLLPKTVEKLREKFITQCKKGTLIISHGFKIKGFDGHLIDKIDRDIFPTYYYRV